MAHLGVVIQTPSIWPKTSMLLGSAWRNEDRRIGLGGALVVAQLLQPAVAPIAGTLRFPKDFAAFLAEGRGHVLDRIAAELALGDRRDGVVREAAAQQRFELQLLHLALQLLRALLGFALQLLDLLLHAEDRLLPFLDLQLHRLLGLGLGALLDFRLLLAHALFDGKVQLAPGVVQLPRLPQGLGLRFLRLLKLDRALIGELGLLFQQLILVVQIERELGRRLLLLFRRDLLALALQPLRDLRVDRFLGLFDRLGLRADGRLALGDLGFLLAQLRLVLALHRLDERRGERLGELDPGPAVRTNDRRFQARVLLKIRGQATASRGKDCIPAAQIYPVPEVIHATKGCPNVPDWVLPISAARDRPKPRNGRGRTRQGGRQGLPLLRRPRLLLLS